MQNPVPTPLSDAVPTPGLRRAAALAVALLAALVTAAPARDVAAVDTRTRAEHVVLISIDGLRPEFYRDTAYPMPLLQRWAAEGAQAEEVVGIFPSVTYPSHTTMITGALPAQHGIYYNSPFEREGQTGRWYWEASAIKCRTIWDACREAGKKTATVSWPVTVGGPIDLNVTEIWPLDWDKETVLDTVSRTSTPGLLDELQREVTGRLTKETFTLDWSSRDVRAAQVAAYLLEKHRPSLMAVHLLSADHFEHQHGREHARVRQALAMLDACLGLIEEAADRAEILDKTAFVITGDHGFVNTHQQLAPNVWLIEHGLRGPDKDRGPKWRATFHASGGGAFLILNDPQDQAAVAEVKALLEGLPPAVRRGFRVLERAELDRYGVDPAAQLALAGEDGWCFTSAEKGPAVRPSSGGTHGFLPELPRMQTGLVAWGSGVRGGAVARRLDLPDVAPLVMRLLEVPFDAPAGILPGGFVRNAKK